MKQRSFGFTLIEILIAMAITAIITVSAYSVLTNGIKSRKSSEKAQESLSQLQRAMNRLAMDFEQLAHRRVRNEYGDLQPVLHGDDNEEDTFISWTRQGKLNPANLPRSELERITYRIEDEHLLRERWTVLDLVNDDQKIAQKILANVKSFSVSFYLEEKWVERWPQEDNTESGGAILLPEAVKINLDLANYGMLEQIYLIPSFRPSGSSNNALNNQHNNRNGNI